MLSFWATTRTCTHVRNTRYPLVTWLPAQMSPKNSNYQQYTKWVAALRNAYWKAKKVLQLKRTVTMTANEKMMCICCTVGGDDGKNWSLKMYKEQSLKFYQFVCTNHFCCWYGFFSGKLIFFSAALFNACVRVRVHVRSSTQSSAFFDIIFTLLFCAVLCTIVFSFVVQFLFISSLPTTIRNFYFDYSVIWFALITNCLNAI